MREGNYFIRYPARLSYVYFIVYVFLQNEFHLTSAMPRLSPCETLRDDRVRARNTCVNVRGNVFTSANVFQRARVRSKGAFDTSL